jgi:flagellar basal-body rod protein FlgF/flagellar basal-body rod protein FlgG
MANSALVGLSSQMAIQRELDTVANNIANLNTAGYKKDGTVFHEFLSPTARELRFGAADHRIRFVHDRANWRDFSQGALQQTGGPLDIAIDGDAFLAVQTPRGERYTRNGALQINAQGQLVTLDGAAVQGDSGPIVFQPLDRNITIAADGRVTVTEGANTKTESLRGKIRLVSFAQNAQLLKDGTNTFKAPVGLVPQAATKARVVQGAVERSNVNGVLEITRLIAITRAYTQIANLLQQHSDLRRSSIQHLADVPA